MCIIQYGYLSTADFIIKKNIQISLMEDNGVEDDQIDFSIISPENHKPKQIDFSVNELLQQAQNKSNTQENKNQSVSIQQQVIAQGSFIKDLQKIQKQLSYQTIPYDIFQPTQQFVQHTGTLQPKHQDTYTKTTNNVTNMTKHCVKNIQIDFKHLIIDFTEDKFNKLKIKQSFDGYFQEEILTTKMTYQKHSEKQLGSKSVKTPSILHKNNSPKHKIFVSPLRQSKQKLKQRSKTKISQLTTKRSLSKLSTINIASSNKLSKSKQIKSPKQQLSKQKSKNKLKEKLKIKTNSNTKIKINKQKSPNRLKSEVYSQYFGFEGQIRSPNKKTKKSTSKNKKIILTIKNINLHK